MNRNIKAAIFLLIIDIFSFYISLSLAYFTRKILNLLPLDIITFNLELSHFLKLWWIPSIYIILIAYEKLYTRRYPFWDETKELLKAITMATVIIFAIVSLGKMTHEISRLTIIFLWMYSIFLFPIFRLIGKRILYMLGIWQKNLLIIGAGNAGINTAKGLSQDKHTGYKVVGFLDDYKKDPVEIHDSKVPILGKIKDFENIIKNTEIGAVVVAIPSLEKEKLSKLTNHIHRYVRRIFVVPDLKGIALLNSELYHLFMQQLFLIKINNNLDSNFNRFTKRFFDLVLSILLLPFLLIIILIISILIKLDSKGEVFFVQERLGKDGKIFKCIKFRSMYKNSDEILKKYLEENPEAKEEWEKFKKLKGHDPRVTRVGKILRKTSLDELPQIFNVLKGDMSLVGPRPYLPREIEDMGDYADVILMTLPGITGLWQVSGRNELEFEDRLKLDTWYVLNWSLWLDVVILFKTIKVVLKREGAY
ncbi:undecaprenyl-phosphate galactose phosphotransferase WbaP [Persephonella sp.]